jgi:hypothetical protein
MDKMDNSVIVTKLLDYNGLRRKGYRTLWVGEGKVCMVPGGEPVDLPIITAVDSESAEETN